MDMRARTGGQRWAGDGQSSEWTLKEPKEKQKPSK